MAWRSHVNSDGLIVRQLDHIVIRVSDVRPLHTLLSETFQLPVSWPIQSFPSFMSGGIALGNVNSENQVVIDSEKIYGLDVRPG